jgi:hypothetical protein
MRAFVASLIACALLLVVPALALGNDKDGTPADPNTATAKSNSNSTTAAAPANSAAPAATAESRLESELDQLRDLLVAQSKQLQEQSQELKEQREKTAVLEEKLGAATPSATSSTSTGSALHNPNANASISSYASAAMPNGSVEVASAATSIVGTPPASSSSAAEPSADTDEPLAIHFKGITLTPGGFTEFANVWRQHALSADVVTPFNSIPFPDSAQSHMSEFNESGRQSRIAMLMEGKLGTVKIGGYYETDFLGTGITSNYTESNSYVLRTRQFWGQAAFTSGWTVTGGQMWSLLTETKHGLDPRTEALPMVIDGQYHVGFTWARQPELRVTKNFHDKIWLGFSVENAETTVTAHNENGNFLVGSFGNSSGLLNPTANYAFTTAPDFVFKAAFEPGWGHYEIFGEVSTFRDRVYPNYTTATPGLDAFNDHRPGGGIGANARVPLFHKKLDAGIHFFGGDGTGRYGSSTLADATVRPDGTLAPIHNYQSLGTLEWHTTPKMDVYAYVGGEYDARTAFINAGKGEGYGSPFADNAGCFAEPAPGSSTSTATGVGGATGFVPGTVATCTGDTRNIVQGTLGYWYRFYKGPKGTVQWGEQYSYIVRNTWSGTDSGTTAGLAPHGVESMVISSFRYYLP